MCRAAEMERKLDYGRYPNAHPAGSAGTAFMRKASERLIEYGEEILAYCREEVSRPCSGDVCKMSAQSSVANERSVFPSAVLRTRSDIIQGQLVELLDNNEAPPFHHLDVALPIVLHSLLSSLVSRSGISLVRTLSLRETISSLSQHINA
jgi:hypothetical protein